MGLKMRHMHQPEQGGRDLAENQAGPLARYWPVPAVHCQQ